MFTDNLEKKYTPGRDSHLFLLLLGLLFAALVAWSAVGRIDIVSIADGQVIPSSRV